MVSILVVEDDEHKQRRIERVFDRLGRTDLSIVVKDNANDAYVWLKTNHCDVLILDLQIPRHASATPVDSGGEELLRKILRADSNCCIPANCVGLTAFESLRTTFREFFEHETWVIAQYDNSSSDWETTVENSINQGNVRSRPGLRNGVILPLHGIRTMAAWHRTLADLAQAENWICPVHRWWYGRFSLLQFLSPWARSAKVAWFRQRYTEIKSEIICTKRGSELPSVVAHSFGTYILGNALLKYRDIRVDKVILCGCILPRAFPWDKLIENGQVGAVLNDIGNQDPWPRICSFIIPGTGASGRLGFTCSHPQVRQEVHNLKHVEFFDPHQMREHWFRFLRESNKPIPNPSGEFIASVSGDSRVFPLVLSPIIFSILVSMSLGCAYILSKAVVLAIESLVSAIVQLLSANVF